MSVESNPGLNWFCFTVLFDWSRKLAPPSQPIRCKLKPIAPWSLAFSRATGRLHAFTSSCHWLPLIISFTLIGRCNYFGFGFRHSIEKRSKTENNDKCSLAVAFERWQREYFHWEKAGVLERWSIEVSTMTRKISLSSSLCRF